ncbi:MAG: MotA/TolQ/ExbB proton channel family protein [Leptospiraceae bacterium]|nr:MotA/TolQ/ExbB proton channel family protein [Leptospiraceae bacterium]
MRVKFLSMMVCLWVLGGALQAQEAVPASDEAAAVVETQSDAQAFAEAGKFHFGDDPTAWVMIGLFLLALAVVIERTIILRRNKGNNAELVRILAEKLAPGTNPNIDQLSEEVSSKEYGVEGRVAGITLKGWPYGEDAMREYSEAAIIAEQRNLEKRLVVLSTLGVNVPFIGLLGTVLGIMKAFRDLAMLGDSGPAVIMKGISEALIATAMGLGVALPVVFAYNALNRIVRTKISSAQEIATLLRAMRISREAQEHKTPQEVSYGS